MKYRVESLLTISLHKDIEADSAKEAARLAEELGVPGLCHQCSNAGRRHSDTWELGGGLEGDPQEIKVVDE